MIVESTVDASVCKHFHLFYCTDKNKMCDLHGECKAFTTKEKVDCKDFEEDNTYNTQKEGE